MAQAIETVIVQVVRKAGDDGLRISEIVEAVSKARRWNRHTLPKPRWAVTQKLFELREKHVLKMTGERRAARYFVAPAKKAARRTKA